MHYYPRIVLRTRSPLTMAVSPGAVTERPRAPLAVKVLAFVALIFLLERAREVVLPVAIAIILTFLLAPLVRMLRNRGVNEALGAAIVVFGLLFTLGFLGSRLVAPATEWVARAPRSVQQLIDSYERLRKSIPFMAPPEVALRPAVTVKGRPAAEIVPAPAPPTSDPFKDKITIEGIALTGSLIRQATWLLVSTVATIILLFFFLASERWLMARTVEAIPKRRARCLAGRLSRGAARHCPLPWHAGDDQCWRRRGNHLGADGDRIPKPDSVGRRHCSARFHSVFGPVGFCRTAAARWHDHLHDVRRNHCARRRVRPHQRDREQLHRAVDRRPPPRDEPAVCFSGGHGLCMDVGYSGRVLAVPLLVIIRSAARRSKSLRLWCVYLDRGRPELPAMRSLLGIGLRRRRRRASEASAPSGQRTPRRRDAQAEERRSSAEPDPREQQGRPTPRYRIDTLARVEFARGR